MFKNYTPLCCNNSEEQKEIGNKYYECVIAIARDNLKQKDVNFFQDDDAFIV
jgi:hypothetical protein